MREFTALAEGPGKSAMMRSGQFIRVPNGSEITALIRKTFIPCSF